MPEQFYTPPQAAELLGVTSDKVLAWIHAGELPASNCAVRANGDRPRWRIPEDELGKFLIRRRHAASTDGERPKRRRRQATATQHFA